MQDCITAENIFMEKDNEEKEIVGLLGDLDWNTTRNLMIIRLLNCENEIDFMEVMTDFANSIGDEKKLAKKRKELGIKDFSDKDKNLMKKLLGS